MNANSRLPVLPLAALLLAACASAPVAPPPVEKPPRPAFPLKAGPGEPLSPQARRLFDEAVGAREEMDKARALDWAILERRWRAVVDATDAPEAHYNLGVTLERQGRDGEARAEYQRALAIRPFKQAAANLGVLLEKSGDSRGAQAAYDAAARDFPDDTVSRERLAALYLQSGQLDEAWHQAREALLRDPTSVGARKTMARVALARGDLDLAKLVALRLQKSAPDDAEVAYLSGLLMAKQGDDVGAAAQWKKAVALRPDLAVAQAGLLEVALRGERWGEVQSLSARMLADDPSSAPVQLVLGIAERHGGKPDQALASYAAAERLAAGKLSEVYLARGVLLMRDKGDCAGALREFDQYERSAGPVLPQGSPAPKLIRECQEQVEQGKAAVEAAHQMQAEGKKKGSATPAPAPAPAAETAAPSPPGAAADTGAPREAAEGEEKSAGAEEAEPPAATEGQAPARVDIAPPPASKQPPGTKP